MKHNSVWGKILLLVMSVVLALSCLVACNDEEVGKLEETTATIDADLTELKDLVNQIKTTADAAATAAKLAEVATKLDAVSAKADAAATAKVVADAKTELKALIETNKTGLADAKTAIETAVAKLAEVEAKLAEVETKLDGKIADFTAEINAIKGAATELEESVEASIEALTTKYTTLKASVDAKADASELEAVASDVEALQAALELANEQIQALQDAPSFAEDYQFATAVLYGDEKVEGVEYSLEAFDALVATVKASDYGVEDYAEFEALVARLEFFLGRAISVDAIIDCFEKLQVAIDEMPTLLASLNAKVNEVEVVTVDPAYLNGMKDIHDKIEALNNNADPADDIEIGAELQAKYELIVAAHDNLVDAAAETADAVAAIDAIGYVVYIDSEAAIDAAELAIEDYSDAFFTNDAWNAYYEVEAKDLISNYATYETAIARYAQLDAANTNKVNVAAVALNYDNARPLWSDKAALDEDKAEYATWLETYQINETADAASIANIYGTEIEYLNKASAYADAMTLVYTNTVFVADEVVGVDALNAKIDALVSLNTPLVLWTELSNAEALDDMIEALEDAVAACVGAEFDAAKDSNAKVMIGETRKANFASVLFAMQQLDIAETMLDALYDNNDHLLGNVTFDDYDDIVALKNAVAQVYADYYVTVGDANYLAFAQDNDVNTLIVNLEAEYNSITARVREIYDNVNKYLDPNADMPLAFGDQLDGFMDEVVKIMAMGVTNVNLPLLGEGDAEDVNLSTLFDNLEIVIGKYVEKAEQAQTAASTINALIGSIASPETLNNYDAIVDVYEALQDWIETYLAADLEVAEGDVVAALEAVAAVKVYGVDDTYDFVTVAKYNACIDTHNAVVELYNAANDAWNNTLKGELDAFVSGDWDIHDEDAFDAALEKWNTYLDLYYGASIADGVGEFAEVAAYELFKAEYDDCKILVGEADGKKQAIENAIGALEDITNLNYANQLILIDGINDLIDEYVNTYCPNATTETDDWCTSCLNRELFVELRVKEALAKLYKYAEATKLLTDADKDASIDATVTMWEVVIAKADNTATINSTLSTAKSAIAKKAPCCVPDAAADAHLDENNDCACDLCGNVVAHVDVNPKDCKCDKCGADLGHVDVENVDCVCDECGKNLGHVDVDPKDCECDNCGAVQAHQHNDDDCFCDICGTAEHEDTAFGGSADGICDWCGEAC